MPCAMKYLDAAEYLEDQWRLAALVRRGGWRPDWIVGLWRGGAPVAIAVHEFLKASGWDVRHIPLKCSSYSGICGRPGDVEFTLGEEVFSLLREGDKVLVVDDVFDTGKTAAAVARRLAPKNLDLRFACVYYKPDKNETERTPDYSVNDADSGWLVFPHEIDGLSSFELRRKSPLLAELLGSSGA